MKKSEIEDLLLQAQDILSDWSYIKHKVPELLETLENLEMVYKDQEDELSDAMEELKKILDNE